MRQGVGQGEAGTWGKWGIAEKTRQRHGDESNKTRGDVRKPVKA